MITYNKLIPYTFLCWELQKKQSIHIENKRINIYTTRVSFSCSTNMHYSLFFELSVIIVIAKKV